MLISTAPTEIGLGAHFELPEASDVSKPSTNNAHKLTTVPNILLREFLLKGNYFTRSTSMDYI